MERNVYLPKENVSFHEGNLLCAGCKASAPTAKVIYKVHFKTSKIYRQQIEKLLHKFKENINK